MPRLRSLSAPGRLARLAGLALAGAALLGCETNSFIDPSNLGRWEFTPTTVPILERLTAIEGPPGAASVETSPVRPEDLIPEVEAYRLGPGDSIEVRIQDFFGGGREEIYPREIDPRGFIDLPTLGEVLIDGMSVEGVRAAVAQLIIDRGILNDPIVSVQILERRRLTFNVIGAARSPGLYGIPRPDYGLLEGITAAGGIPESVQFVYVIRRIPLSEKVIRGSAPRPAGAAPSPAPGQMPAPGPGPSTPATTPPPEDVIDLIDELSRPPAGARPTLMSAARSSRQDAPAQPPAPPPGTEPVVDLDAPPAATPNRPAPVPIDTTPERDPAPERPAAAPPAGPAIPAERRSAPVSANAPAPAPAAPAPTSAGSTPSGLAGEREDAFWIFRDGKWVQVRRARALPVAPAATPAAATPSTPGAAASPAGGPAAGPSSAQPLPPGRGPGPDGLMPIPAPLPPVDMPGLTPDAAPGPAPAPLPAAPSVPGAEDLVTQRVIEVPAGPLLAGSAQFNIIVRPGDVIRVPSPAEGLVYIAGEVNRPGPYSLPAVGKLTLLRAINAAGGLSNTAIPERVDLTRMVGPDRQATVRLNLRAIAEGTQPDVFLKPDDMVNVGTNFWAFPLAVIRGGFRASYGFGFILDRNFERDVFGNTNNNN